MSEGQKLGHAKIADVIGDGSPLSRAKHLLTHREMEYQDALFQGDPAWLETRKEKLEQARASVEYLTKKERKRRRK